MKKSMEFLARLAQDEEGTSMVEYSILLGLIAVAAITAVIGIGGWVTAQFTGLCTTLSGKGFGATALTCS